MSVKKQTGKEALEQIFGGEIVDEQTGMHYPIGLERLADGPMPHGIPMPATEDQQKAWEEASRANMIEVQAGNARQAFLDGAFLELGRSMAASLLKEKLRTYDIVATLLQEATHLRDMVEKIVDAETD